MSFERPVDSLHGRLGDAIRMLGATRATKNCTSCHNVPEGTLLGGLSYTLKKQKTTAY